MKNNYSTFVSFKNNKYTFTDSVSESELLKFVASLLEKKASVCGEFFDSSEKVAYLISLKLSMYDR